MERAGIVVIIIGGAVLLRLGIVKGLLKALRTASIRRNGLPATGTEDERLRFELGRHAGVLSSAATCSNQEISGQRWSGVL